MRRALLALALLFATPAAAQQNPAEVQRAAAALAAIWRPVDGPMTATTLTAACSGAVEEIAAVEAALPPVLSPESLARVRGLRGLLIIPTGDDPAWFYLFPPIGLDWVTPGMGRVTVVSEAEGFLTIQDGSGASISSQLGRAGQWPVLRLRSPDGPLLNYVGCAPTG
jgi:hypothetical protein